MPQLPASSFSFITIFDKNSNPKKVVIRDTTDYPAIGISAANVFVYLKVSYVAANGNVTVFYNNFNNALGAGADLTRSLGTDSTSTIPLPLQADGNVSFGDFVIEAQYDYLDSSSNQFITQKSYTYSYTWTPPKVCIMKRINLASSNITTTDTTNYGAYLTLSRTHTISPPPNAQLPPLSMGVSTTTQAINVYQDIATGTWGAKVVSVVTYIFDEERRGGNRDVIISGLEVIEQLIGCIEFQVTSDLDINKLLCCLGDIKALYQRELISNAQKAQNIYEDKIKPLQLEMVFYFSFMAAGCLEKAAASVERLKQISGCSDLCCGFDDCPTPIPVITGGGNFYNVDSPDASILVVPEVIGNTTTFHITVNPSIIPDIIAYNVVGNSPISVSTTVDSITGNVTFTISTDRPLGLVDNACVIRVNISNSSGSWTIAKDNIYIDSAGGLINAFTNQSVVFTGTTLDTDFIAFKWSDFFGDAGGTLVPQQFVVSAQVNNSNYFSEDATTVLAFLGLLNSCEANVMWIENDITTKGNATIIRLYNPVNGEILKYGDFAEFAETNLQIYVRVQAKAS